MKLPMRVAHAMLVPGPRTDPIEFDDRPRGRHSKSTATTDVVERALYEMHRPTKRIGERNVDPGVGQPNDTGPECRETDLDT
jgi:hypothetical protein